MAGAARRALPLVERAVAPAAGRESNARGRAELDFTWARALTAAHREPARARALAEGPRATLGQRPQLLRERTAVDGWLRRQGWARAAATGYAGLSRK